jgi:hypothetical protein
MIKKVVIALCSGMIVIAAHAQYRTPSQPNTYTDDDGTTGFKKQNLFIGGGLELGFGSDNFDIGINPEVGYSLNRWLDVGVVANFLYSNVSADPTLYYNDDIGSRQFVYGGGVFGRAYVLPFLFLTAQPEFNWISTSFNGSNSVGLPSITTNAPSLLLGLGYGRRVVGQSSFYISLMFDVLQNVNSPYNDALGHPLPVLRAGFDFYLHGNKSSSYYRN